MQCTISLSKNWYTWHLWIFHGCHTKGEVVMTDKEKIEKAVKIAWQYAQYNGSHHKM